MRRVGQQEGTSSIMEMISEIEEMVDSLGYPPRAPGGEGIPKRPVSWAVANVLSLPLSQAARILLISSLLGSDGRDVDCRFNELASLSGLSERTAYRALKEIKGSGFFEIQVTPGSGVRISAGWFWDEPRERAGDFFQKGALR